MSTTPSWKAELVDSNSAAFRVAPGVIREDEDSPERSARYLHVSAGFRLCTRVLDLLIGGIGLVLAAPLFVLAAVLIKSESAGPVFFSQDRVGLQRKRFK